jgi:hypothetical protein
MCSNFFSLFFITSIVSVILSYVCPVFNIWFEYRELPFLLLIANICSLYLVWNVLPVCPMYFNGKSRYLICYMPLFSYLSVCEYGFIVLCSVFWMLFCLVFSFKSFVILFLSFPLYVKAAHFTLWCCGSVFLFCSCVVGCFLIQFVLYLLSCSMFLKHYTR